MLSQLYLCCALSPTLLLSSSAEVFQNWAPGLASQESLPSSFQLKHYVIYLPPRVYYLCSVSLLQYLPHSIVMDFTIVLFHSSASCETSSYMFKCILDFKDLSFCLGSSWTFTSTVKRSVYMGQFGKAQQIFAAQASRLSWKIYSQYVQDS